MIDNSKVISADKLKDVLITRTATKLLTSEPLVEKIINHQFFSIKEALKIRKQVEIYEIGKFQISKNKLRRRINELERIEREAQKFHDTKAPDNRKPSLIKRIDNIRAKLEVLKAKI